MNDFKWLSRDKLSAQIASAFPGGREEICFCKFRLKSKILERIIPAKADDEVAPWTEPGPCLKWYGSFKDVYFRLISRIGQDQMLDLFIRGFDSDLIDWRIFRNRMFPPSLVKRLVWINGAKDAACSLFCLDDDDLPYEFYRAQDEDDAHQLKNFLEENNFPRKILMDTAESLDLTWIVENEEKVVARYISRYACQRYAVRMSQQNHTDYSVKCESNSKISPTIFHQGKIIT
jgi:hypothetical protein